MKKTTMNEDILKYPIYEYKEGQLFEIDWIKSTADYNHYTHNLHHFVERKTLKKYPHLEKWQKLILMPVDMNMDIEKRTAGFEERWKIKLEKVVLMPKLHRGKEE